jgi:ATP-binding cassette, subfamily B, bacterial CvaB/MchF/RaxB
MIAVASQLPLGLFPSRRQLPVIQQAEAAECGLACLAMIARYHGHEIDIGTLRSQHPQSLHGATLRTLMDIANDLQLAPRALRFELSSIHALQTPCLLHWNMSHFVVLKGIRGKRAVIHDPARGKLSCTLEELGNAASGVALELMPVQDFTAMHSRSRLRFSDLWSNIHGLPLSLAIIIGLSLLLQFIALASPLYLQFVVDEVITRHAGDLLRALATGFALLLLLEVATQTLRQLVVLSFSSILNLQLATNLLNHLLQLPLEYFQLRHLGDIVSRCGSIGAIRQLFTEGVASLFVDGLLSLVTLLAMFAYNAKLTLFAMGACALYLVSRTLLYPASRRKMADSISADARTQSSLMESIRGITTIKLHQKENQRLEQWQSRLIATMTAEIGVRKLGIAQDAINTTVFGLTHLVLIYIAAHSVMAGAMSIGMLYAFMSYTQRFIKGTESLIDQFIEFRMLGVHLERLADIVLAPVERGSCSKLGAGKVPHASDSSGRLEIEAVSFTYSGCQQPVFSNVSFTVASGEIIALTGTSGCGKSTLLHCLAGLLKPTHGHVRWNGRSIFAAQDYRSSIACVMQDDQLLSGSIADNICFFDPEPDREKIALCASAACIHEDILRLPMQYNTLIGDMGSSLSGGQKQRICIARALYRQPSILLMDEATSHLDPDCERQVSNNISQLPITRIIVAHRRETIATATRIIDLGETTHPATARPDSRGL